MSTWATTPDAFERAVAFYANNLARHPYPIFAEDFGREFEVEGGEVVKVAGYVTTPTRYALVVRDVAGQLRTMDPTIFVRVIGRTNPQYVSPFNKEKSA